MKTKHILTAMVLPTMLAACTADEIVENNNNVAMDRADVPAVSFVTEGLGSRLAFNETQLKWDWEGTDKFLLLQADGGYNNVAATALPGERFSAGAPSTGYEYAKGENGVYTTSAAVMEEGLYWGFAPSFDKKYKGYVKFELPTAQYMHVKGEADTYNNEELAALITPLYEVSALNEGDFYNKLPLDMIGFYSTLVMPLKNNTDEDIAINQIVFEADEALTVAGRINTEAMADYIVASDGEEWAPAVNFDDDDENDYDDVADMLKDMREEYLACDFDKDAGDKQSKVIVLNLGGHVLKAGKTEKFYMLVPASKNAIDYTITIVAEEGLVKINSSFASNSMQETVINHSANKTAFGMTNSGNPRSYVIDEADFQDIDNAYYVTNAKEMMRILDEDVNGTINVYNVGDWGVEANLVKAIKNSDVFVNFLNDIEVEGAALSAEKALELTKMAFEKTATVKKNTKVDFKLGKYQEGANKDAAIAEVDYLVIEEGAEVTLTSGDFNTVKNYGSLTIVKGTNLDVASAEVTTDGILNLKNIEAGEVILNKGELNYVATDVNNAWFADWSKVTLPSSLEADIDITVGTNVTLNMAAANASENQTPTGKDEDGEVAYYTNFTNNGTIKTDAGYLNVSGTLINNADATIAGTYAVIINGTATNNGMLIPGGVVIKEDAELTNNATVYAEGSAAYNVVTNNGTIITGVDSYTTVNSGAGRINNTAKGRVYNKTTTQTVFYQFAGTVEELEAIKFDRVGMAINTIQINGTLTLDEQFTKPELFANITKLELAANARVNIDDKIGVCFSTIEVLDGVAVTFQGYSVADTYIDMYAPTGATEVNVNLGKGSSITVINAALGKVTSGNSTTVKLNGPELTDDDDTTDTNPWYAAAAKVYNKSGLIKATTTSNNVVTTADATSKTATIYWEGAEAQQ